MKLVRFQDQGPSGAGTSRLGKLVQGYVVALPELPGIDGSMRALLAATTRCGRNSKRRTARRSNWRTQSCWRRSMTRKNSLQSA